MIYFDMLNRKLYFSIQLVKLYFRLLFRIVRMLFDFPYLSQVPFAMTKNINVNLVGIGPAWL